MTNAKASRIKSFIDWGAYAFLGGIGSAILVQMNTALDLLHSHGNDLARIATWIHIAADKLSLPFQ